MILGSQTGQCDERLYLGGSGMKMSDAVDAVEFDSIAESARVVISNVNLQYRGFYSLQPFF